MKEVWKEESLTVSKDMMIGRKFGRLEGRKEVWMDRRNQVRKEGPKRASTSLTHMYQ